MDLERVQHALPGHDDLLGLLLHRQGPDKGSNLLGRLPLGQLSQPLLSSPHRGVDNLEEQLSCPRVEDEDGSVDGFSCQITLECLVDCDPVHVGVVHEPDDLVREELAVVLRREVRLVRLRRVELQPLVDALAQRAERRVGPRGARRTCGRRGGWR